MGSLAFGPLPRYLRRLLLWRVLAVLLALGGLLQILDLLEATTEIMSRGQGIAGVVHYVSLRSPTLLLQALPLAALIGAAFAFRTLAQEQAVVALRAAGLPFRHTIAVLLPVVAGFALLHVVLAEHAVPASQRALTAWWASLPPAKEKAEDVDLFWFKSAGDLVGVVRVSPDGERMEGVRIFRRDAQGRLVSRTLAAEARHRNGRWTLLDVRTTGFEQHAISDTEPVMDWPTTLRPADVQRLAADEPYVSGKLAAAVLAGQESGMKTFAFYRTRVAKALADPAVPLVMLLLATPVAVAMTRGGSGAPMLVALGSGLVFLLMHGLASALGEAGIVQPLVAAWLAPCTFGLLGLLFLTRLDRHQ